MKKMFLTSSFADVADLFLKFTGGEMRWQNGYLHSYCEPRGRGEVLCVRWQGSPRKAGCYR